jgi:hypothetical protein
MLRSIIDFCHTNNARSQSLIGNALATAILLRDEALLAKKTSANAGNDPAFHGLRSWSFGDTHVPNLEIGNEEFAKAPQP